MNARCTSSLVFNPLKVVINIAKYGLLFAFDEFVDYGTLIFHRKDTDSDGIQHKKLSRWHFFDSHDATVHFKQLLQKDSDNQPAIQHVNNN